MLEKLYIAKNESEKAYGLKLPFDAEWNTAKKRVLVVLQTVDGRDLKAKIMLGDKDVKRAFCNAVKYARNHARKYEPNLPSPAFAVANFNNYKHLHMRGHAKAEAEAEFRTRLLELIKKFDPTHILFSGDVSSLYPIENSNYKNGWVHKIDGRLVTSTVDFSRLLEKKGALANLLGFWCRHLSNLLIGRNPHDLSSLKAKPVYINTMERFEKLMQQWDKAKLAGIDTETRNLSVLKNAIYTIQFCFDNKPSTGYVLPIDHPHSNNPFTLEERKEIKRQLQKRFGAEKGPELITMNGMFDLRVIRAALKLDIIYHRVWEVTAGEHLLDENISSLSGIGIKSGGLAAIYCAYGNDHYYSKEAVFSKEERTQTGNTDPGDPDFHLYCFPRGQEVLTTVGRVPIESLNVGDRVLSFDHDKSLLEYKKVVATIKHKTRKRLVRVSFGSNSFVCTEDHPIWSEDQKKYIPAGMLRPGERLKVV